MKVDFRFMTVPSNLIIKKVSPRIWLSVLTVAWGIIGMCMGFVKNYTGLMIVRAFLGIAEGGLLPGIVFYLPLLYKRSEVGLVSATSDTESTESDSPPGSAVRPNLFERQSEWCFRWSPGPRAERDGWARRTRGLAVDHHYRGHPYRIGRSVGVLCVARNGRQGSLPLDFAYGGYLPVLSRPRLMLTGLKTWLSAGAYFAILTALYSFSLFVPTM